jgi:hypothetical protein
LSSFREEPAQIIDWSFVLGLKTTWDLHVYIHPPGDEIWLSFVSFPNDMSYFLLNVNNTNGIASTDLAIVEKEIVLQDKPSSPCKFYNGQVILKPKSFLNMQIFYLYYLMIVRLL